MILTFSIWKLALHNVHNKPQYAVKTLTRNCDVEMIAHIASYTEQSIFYLAYGFALHADIIHMEVTDSTL